MGAGELADHFDVSKPTMSAHFAVLIDWQVRAAEDIAATLAPRAMDPLAHWNQLRFGSIAARTMQQSGQA